ncbi:MAG: GNAT family N-acetyltransferase [Oscillospiraceae bacterium]|nr:GNAT family N-acetyltransferase [Oscillospiraceae bacterium]
MTFEPVEIILKDGRTAVLRTAQIADAAEMLAFRIKSLGQTDYLMQYPEEMADYTIEKQLNFINRMIESPNDKMFTVIVDGKIAGTGQVSFNTRIKTRHKAGIGIALLKEYWGLGIGSAIFTEIIKSAQSRDGVELLELEVIEGNERAIALYKKFGFEIVAEIPDAIRLKDGTSLKEITMMKKL